MLTHRKQFHGIRGGAGAGGWGGIRSCFHKSSIQPSAEQGRQIFASDKAIIKAIFLNDLASRVTKRSKLSMYLSTASRGYTQTTSSAVLSNVNAVSSVLTALRMVQFSNTARFKERTKSQMAHCCCSAYTAECSGTDVGDCFPCTNAAQSPLCVLLMSGKLRHYR